MLHPLQTTRSQVYEYLSTLCRRIALKLTQTQQFDSILLHNINLGRIVPSMLNFTNMTSSQQELARTTLSNPPTNSLGQCPIQEHLVPNKLFAFIHTAQIQLLQEYLGVNTDTHG